MNTAKLTLRSHPGLRLSLRGCRVVGTLALLLSASCQSAGADHAAAAAAADEHHAPLFSAPAALTQPEPGADAAEYSTRLVTLRLFGTSGVTSGEPAGESPAFATLADTATWTTANYHLGQSVGRSLRIVAIFEDGIELADSLAGPGAAHLRLQAGEDLRLRLVEHRFDRAVIDEGAHQFRLHGSSMAALGQRYGLGASVLRMSAAFAGHQGLQLVRLDPQGVLGRLGLLSGDRLLAIDGQTASSEALATLPARVAQPGVLLLTVARGGNVWEAAYVVQD